LCRFWQNFLHPSVKKSSWTPEEIDRLQELVKKYGERHWEAVAQEMGVRISHTLSLSLTLSLTHSLTHVSAVPYRIIDRLSR